VEHNPDRHVVLVQYAGEYAEAFWRLASGGQENYGFQKYSMDAVADLQDSHTSVSSVCCVSPERHDEVLPNGVRSVALGFRAAAVDQRQLWQAIAELRPTQIVLRTPMLRVLREARRNQIPVMALLADSFLEKGLRSWARHRLLARELNQPNVLVVADHGRNSCENLVAMGVRASKVVSWDWPHAESVHPPKLHPGSRTWDLFYAGMIIEDKGLGDMIEAVALLQREGRDVRLTCCGAGEIDKFRALAVQRGVSHRVDFQGLVSNAAVTAKMRSSDLVLVPSRHRYSEGSPKTIREAFGARTPVIGSDHPMFGGVLVDGENAVVFRAGEPRALADGVRHLMEGAALYERLSLHGAAGSHRLAADFTWAGALQAWVGTLRPQASHTTTPNSFKDLSYSSGPRAG
jgi:glycosyltransferase involved in cell wall biosynthesis